MTGLWSTPGIMRIFCLLGDTIYIVNTKPNKLSKNRIIATTLTLFSIILSVIYFKLETGPGNASYHWFAIFLVVLITSAVIYVHSSITASRKDSTKTNLKKIVVLLLIIPTVLTLLVFLSLLFFGLNT